MAVSKLINVATLLELQAKINELIGELTEGGLGVFSFEVNEEGELLLHFSGDTPPDFKIIDGYLVYTFEEGEEGVNLGRVTGFNGVDGADGKDGKDGTNGINGSSADITSVTAVGLAAGASPTVTLGGTTLARTIQFGIPAGAKGTDGTNGTNGTSADITGVTATALAAGANPTAVLGGTTLARTIQFGIPAGTTGPAGASVSAVQAVDLSTAISLSNANPNNIYFVR